MATPEQEKAAAEQRALNEESRAGIAKTLTEALAWEGAEQPSGPTMRDFTANKAERQRAEKDAIKAQQAAASAAKFEERLSRRDATSDRFRVLPTPPPAASFPTEAPDPAKAGNAGSVTEQVTRSGTQLRDATLQAEQLAREAAYTAAVEQSRIKSEYAGLGADTIEALASNVEDANDEVHQLWEAANDRQAQRTRAIEEMIDAGRKNMADPTAFFGSNKAAAGFGAGMAVAAGHLASALGGGPNTALKIIDKAIERQLRADEFNISQATIRDQQAISLLDKWRQLTKDQVEARTLAKLNLIQQAEFQIEAQALRMDSELAKQNLAAVKSALLAQKADLMRQHDERQKWSTSTQTHRLIPLAVQDREQRKAAEQASLAPQPSSVQTTTGTPSALVSALGQRATFDTGADIQTESGQSVPSSIASPELLAEEGMPLRAVGAGEIFDAAFQVAEGDDRQKNRAAGKAVIDAGIEEVQALWESGVVDPVGLKAAWDQSEVLRESFPDWRDLIPPSADQERRAGQTGAIFYETNPGVVKKLTGEAYSEATNTIGRGADILVGVDDLEENVGDLKRALGGVTRRADGGVDIDRLDPELREQVLDFQQQMDEVFSVVRSMNQSGALQGPGEAQLFKDMSFIPGNADRFVDVLLDGDNMEANLRIQRKMVEKFVDNKANQIGWKSADSMLASPDDIGARLRANRTQ